MFYKKDLHFLISTLDGMPLHSYLIKHTDATILSGDFSTYLFNHSPRICTSSVQLINESKARNFISSHLTIHRNWLALNSTNATKHKNGAVQNSQCSLHFDGKINMSRGVDDINLPINLQWLGKKISQKKKMREIKIIIQRLAIVRTKALKRFFSIYVIAIARIKSYNRRNKEQTSSSSKRSQYIGQRHWLQEKVRWKKIINGDEGSYCLRDGDS